MAVLGAAAQSPWQVEDVTPEAAAAIAKAAGAKQPAAAGLEAVGSPPRFPATVRRQRSGAVIRPVIRLTMNPVPAQPAAPAAPADTAAAAAAQPTAADESADAAARAASAAAQGLAEQAAAATVSASAAAQGQESQAGQGSNLEQQLVAAAQQAQMGCVSVAPGDARPIDVLASAAGAIVPASAQQPRPHSASMSPAGADAAATLMSLQPFVAAAADAAGSRAANSRPVHSGGAAAGGRAGQSPVAAAGLSPGEAEAGTAAAAAAPARAASGQQGSATEPLQQDTAIGDGSGGGPVASGSWRVGEDDEGADMADVSQPAAGGSADSAHSSGGGSRAKRKAGSDAGGVIPEHADGAKTADGDGSGANAGTAANSGGGGGTTEPPLAGRPAQPAAATASSMHATWAVLPGSSRKRRLKSANAMAQETADDQVKSECQGCWSCPVQSCPNTSTIFNVPCSHSILLTPCEQLACFTQTRSLDDPVIKLHAETSP